MEFTITSDNLRASLKEIERAERRGFKHCLAVFQLTSAGCNLTACRAKFSDLWERASETDGSLDWGRFQSVTKRHRFVKGKLVKP